MSLATMTVYEPCEHNDVAVVEHYGLDTTRCLDCNAFLEPCEHPETEVVADELGVRVVCTFCGDEVRE